jgi:peptidyl-prolyl cis-trans isomerase SurA
MWKLLTAIVLLINFSVSAQTLFYYGNDSVSVNEFLRAYQKNNTGVKNEKAFRDYLDLFIASRLKIKEAKNLGLDTLPQMVADLENLRQQILPAYLNDKEGLAKLVDEAFVRSQKDIHLSHIFIGNTPGIPADELRSKANAAMAELNSGKDFAAVAVQYSNDPSAPVNGGNIGWITVFSLPYELENLAYSIEPGKTGMIQSRAGYHIFKNLGERRDPGRIKAAQILLAFQPGETEQSKAVIKKQADSIYNRLIKGEDFAKLASEYSNDVISAAANGQMQEFGVGYYDPVFERQAYALTRDGAISKPFETAHGYHIVKRLSRVPLATTKTAKAMEALQAKVEQSDRINSIKNALANKIIQSHSKKASFNEHELWAFSDSILNYKPAGMPLHLDYSTELIRFGNKSYMVSEWMNFIQGSRYKTDGTGVKPYTQLWNEFMNTSALDYYQFRLEDFNDEFRYQLEEFKEGNLFFEIMQQKVWSPAQNDSAALLNYYNQNRTKYNWNKSVDAVIFYSSDAAIAKTFITQLKKSPKNWNQLLSQFSEKISADSARFELHQIPNPTKIPLKAGTITSVLVNKSDNTASFAYIIRNYDKSAPRSFNEARGLVINDYQQQLEKNWMEELRKKYPVRVNEKEMRKLIAAKKY